MNVLTAVDATHPRPPHIVLVGLMGSGKTTVGRVLAERLGRRLVDSDATIERLTGRTVREIRRESGTAAMRRHEADALFDALDDDEPAVIAAAAGIVLDPEHRRRLAESTAFIVWLEGPPEVLAARAEGGAHRPFLDRGAVDTLESMLEARAPWYLELADLVVSVDEATPDQVVDRILA